MYTYEPEIINNICCSIRCILLALVIGSTEKNAEIVRVVAPTEAPTAAPILNYLQILWICASHLLLKRLFFLIQIRCREALRKLVAEVEASEGEPIPQGIIQRYALMTLYLSTSSGRWSTSSGWNGFGEDECEWYGIGTRRFLEDGSFGVANVELARSKLT